MVSGQPRGFTRTADREQSAGQCATESLYSDLLAQSEYNYRPVPVLLRLVSRDRRHLFDF